MPFLYLLIKKTDQRRNLLGAGRLKWPLAACGKRE
jgi:hypothetical protein